MILQELHDRKKGFRIALAKATEILPPRHGCRWKSARQFRIFLNCQNNFLHGCKKLCIMLILYTQFAIRGKQDS